LCSTTNKKANLILFWHPYVLQGQKKASIFQRKSEFFYLPPTPYANNKVATQDTTKLIWQLKVEILENEKSVIQTRAEGKSL